jgi:hypothetical protein
MGCAQPLFAQTDMAWRPLVSDEMLVVLSG